MYRNAYIPLPTRIDHFTGSEELGLEDTSVSVKKTPRNLLFPRKASVPPQLSLGSCQLLFSKHGKAFANPSRWISKFPFVLVCWQSSDLQRPVVKTCALANDFDYALFLTFLPVLADFGLWEFSPTLAGADRKNNHLFWIRVEFFIQLKIFQCSVCKLANSALRGLFMLYIVLEISCFSIDFINCVSSTSQHCWISKCLMKKSPLKTLFNRWEN